MKRLSLVLLFLAVGCFHSLAQVGSPGAAPPGVSASMTKLFGDFKGFSAKADMRVREGGKESMQMLVNYIVLDGQLRMEMDLTTMKSEQIPANAIPMMRQMGMDKVHNIVRPDIKRMLVLYPSLKAGLDVPMPMEEAVATETKFKIEKKVEKEEKVDSHPCVKHKVTLTSPKGEKNEAFTWNAKDLKDFPVKIEFLNSGVTVVMTFKEIQFELPKQEQFEFPGDFQKVAGEHALMQMAMQRMQGDAKGNTAPKQ